MSQSKTSGPALGMLPPDLKPMFDPRPPLTWKPPLSKRVAPYVTGLAKLVDVFEKTPPPPKEPFETPRQRRIRVRQEKMQANEARIAEAMKHWDPKSDPNVTGDAYKTLFVSNMSHDTNEKKLRREFESFGPIKAIRVVTDQEGQPRGYAFIEFENDEDMRQAYKKADGKKVDGRRLQVDVERGRTVRGWKPRRFGGGIGESRKAKPKKGEEKFLAREERVKKENEEIDGPGGGGGGGGRGGSSFASSRPDDSRRSSYGGGGGGDYRGGGSSFGGGGSSGGYGGASSSVYGPGGAAAGSSDSRYGRGGSDRNRSDRGRPDDRRDSGRYGSSSDDRRKRSRSRDRGGPDDKRRRGDSRGR